MRDADDDEREDETLSTGPHARIRVAVAVRNPQVTDCGDRAYDGCNQYQDLGPGRAGVARTRSAGKMFKHVGYPISVLFTNVITSETAAAE